MNTAEFRKELVKIMPGYKWTVHTSESSDRRLLATGIQNSGFNRLSTLQVERRDNYASSGAPRYEAKSAGRGTKSPWAHAATGRTLAQALRGLQDHYKREADKYRGLEGDLQVGRAQQGEHNRSPAFIVSLPVPVKPEEPEEGIDDSWMDGYNSAVRMRAECVAAIELAGGQVVPGGH